MSFNGGYINSICLMSILKNPVGYVTGNLTLAGQSVENGNLVLFIHFITLVLCFLLGSIISGLVIKGQNFKIDKRYSMSIILQIAFLAIAITLLFNGLHKAAYLLSLVMGMQNAMTTHYGSALIRTTHMTGTTTDLGILIAQWLKGYKIKFWKMKLNASLIIGFSCGAIGGTLMYHYFTVSALFFSFVFYFFMLSWRLMPQEISAT